MSVQEAAESGSYKDLLVALRDLIARQIDEGCAARDLVGLSKRLVDLAVEIRALEDADKPGLHLVEDETFDANRI